MDVALETSRAGRFDAEWAELARTSPAGVFATPEWHAAIQKAYGDRGTAAVLACREEGRLVGVAPLRFGSELLMRRATLLGMGEGGYGLGDYAGITAAPGHERAVAEAVIGRLIQRRGWDALDLQQLPDGAMLDELSGAMRRAGLRSLVRRHNACHVIELPPTWAAYRSRLSSGARDWLERKPRKAERELGAVLELVGPGDLLDEYATMRRFQARRFGERPAAMERRLGVVIAEWLVLAHRRDWLRMFRLRTSSRTIGVLLGYEYENVFYFHSAAFELLAEGAKYSLGASLLAGALRFSIDRGLGRFDMLRGHYEYKERLGSEKRFNYRLMAFGRSPLGRAAEAALQLQTRLQRKPAWRSTLEDLGERREGLQSPARAAEDLAGSAVGVD